MTVYQDIGESTHYGSKFKLLETSGRRMNIDVNNLGVLFCLPIRRDSPSIHASEESEFDLHGLLLRPTMKRYGEFRRIGSFRCSHDRESLRLPQTSTANISRRFYDDWDGHDQYTFTII